MWLILNNAVELFFGNFLEIPIRFLLTIHFGGIPFIFAKYFKVRSSHVIVSLIICKKSSFILRISGGNIDPPTFVNVRSKLVSLSL